MAAKLYFSPFIPTFTSNGLPSPRASLTFYYTGGTTKAPIYSDSGLTTPMTNPVVADSAGKYANIYLNDAITYAVKTLDKDGAQLGDTIDPYIPTSVASLVATVASAAAAAASAAAASTSAGAAATSAATAAAFTGAKSATTVALISAVRTNGFFPQPVDRIAANDVATVLVGTANTASTINGAGYGSANVPVTNTAKITWLGGASDIDSNLVYFPRGAWYSTDRTSTYTSFEFQHTGTTFEATVTSTAMNSGENFRVIVGDKIAGTGTVPVGGAFYFVKVTFPVSATRRIRIEMAGGRTKGLNVTATTEIAGAGRTYPLVTLVGDSFPEGTGSFPYYDGEGASLLRACGFNPANAGVGGTGLMNPGTGGKVNWQDANRLADLALNGWTDAITGAASVPMMGIIQMSINDFGLGSAYWNGAANYQAAVNKALWVLIDHWNTNRSGKPLVVFGPTNASGIADLDLFRMRDAGQEAVAGASGSNVWFIDRMGPGPLLRSGSLDRLTTTGNTNTNTTLNGLASTTGVIVGASIYGTGIPTGTRVVSIDSSVSITMSNAATATATGVSVTFANSQTAIYTTLSDPTHPNQQGHNLDAIWAARQLRELILTQFA